MGRLLRAPAVALGLAALIVVAAGGAYAATSGGGTISVCVHHKGGALYKARHCAGRDRKLTWNVQGLPGQQGPPGRNGTNGTNASINGVPAGGNLTGSYPNPSIAGGAVTPAKTSGFPGARVESSSVQSIGNVSYVALQFGTVDFNTGGVVSGGAPTKLTAPTTGVYVVTGSAEWASGGIGYRQLEIDRSSDGSRLATELIPVAAAQFTYNNVSTVVKLNAGDSVQPVAEQSSGGPLSVFGAWFAMNWM